MTEHRSDSRPPKRLLVVGGPNGAGKTTFVRRFLDAYADEYLGADAIAEEICPSDPESVPVEAGREFLARLIDRIATGKSVIVESTLAGKSLAKHIQKASDSGFVTALNFVFLDSANTSVARVAQRVRSGGHHVPDEDVRRRFPRSLRNFWTTYRFVVDSWELHVNRGTDYLAVAHGVADNYAVDDLDAFRRFQTSLDNPS